MPRPEKKRIVSSPPLFSSFKPTGVGRRNLKPIIMSLDEYEAVRLADYQGLDHVEAAALMEISRSTFTRLIEKARAKVARFIIEGNELSIEGGNIHFRGNIIRCLDCEHMFRTSIEQVLTECPSCGSKKLLDVAGGFGHGRCCSEHNRSRGRSSGGRGGRGGHHGGRKN